MNRDEYRDQIVTCDVGVSLKKKLHAVGARLLDHVEEKGPAAFYSHIISSHE